MYGKVPWPQAPLPPIDPASILAQLCSFAALLHHEGTVYRDFSASNIRLHLNKTRWVVKVIDLGELAPASASRRESVGTPGFFAPEVLCSQTQRSEKADMFSIGILAFILFTKHNMHADKYSTPKCPPSLAYWICKRIIPSLKSIKEKFRPIVGGLLALEPKNRWSAQKVNHFLWSLSDAPGLPDSRKRTASPGSPLNSKKRRESDASTIRAPGPSSSLALDSLSSADSFVTAEQSQPSEPALGSSTSRQASPSLVAQPAAGRILGRHSGYLPCPSVSAAEGTSQPASLIDAIEWNARGLQPTQGPTGLTSGASAIYRNTQGTSTFSSWVEQPNDDQHDDAVPAVFVSRASSPTPSSAPGTPFVDESESIAEVARVPDHCAVDSGSELEDWDFTFCLDDWYDCPMAKLPRRKAAQRLDQSPRDPSEWRSRRIPSSCKGSVDNDSEADTIRIYRSPLPGPGPSGYDTKERCLDEYADEILGFDEEAALDGV